MKTSSKILLATLGSLFLLILIGLIVLRMNVKNVAKVKVDGNGNVMLEERAPGDYDYIQIKGSFQTRLIPGEQLMRISTDDNLINLITTSVDNKVLEISHSPALGNPTELSLEIGYGSLRGLSVSSGVVLRGDSLIQEKRFELTANGNNKVNLRLKADSLNIGINGPGELSLSGSCTYAYQSLNGPASLNAAELLSNISEIHTSGAANGYVHADSLLIAGMSGSSTVVYKGKPVIEREMSGSATLQKAEDSSD